MNNFTISGFGLNPCCSGLWSRTFFPQALELTLKLVLILVVVDYGLVHIGSKGTKNRKRVLILVVVDYGLVHMCKYEERLYTKS